MSIDNFNRVSEENIRDILLCFDEFSEGKGYLDKDDLKVAMTALLGSRPSKYEIQEILDSTSASVHSRECPGLPKTQFVEIMKRRLAVVDSIDEVRQMFRAFDRGCRGFITREDMRKVVSEVFEEHEMPSTKVAEMFAEADWDHNGRIGYREFESMVTNQFPPDLVRRRYRGILPMSSS